MTFCVPLAGTPLYVAVIWSAPRGRVVNVSLAFPPESVTEPSMVWPCVNVTVPVAVTPDAVVTLAVSVTDWPNTDGFLDEVREVALVTEFTTWLSDPTLVLDCVSPL